MPLRLGVLLLALIALVGGAGYLIGTLLQAPEPIGAVLEDNSAQPLTAPQPLSPLNGSEFVDSDIALSWHWPGELADNQLYTVRIWAEDLPHQEIWAAESTVSVQQTIDSFSLDFGRFYWQVAVINLDAAGAYLSMGSEWSDIVELQRLRRPSLVAKSYEEMSAAARQFADLNLGAADLIDAVHLFIHENSVTDEQLSYSPDYSDAVEIMYRHSRGETTDLPQLLCDGRSTAMLTILKELGIESRLVFLYKDVPGWISEHTVLEIFNPDNQFWQVHDVADDIYYLAAESGIRPNAESILFDSHTDFVGCPVDGSACSAALAEGGVSYFEALHYGHTFEVWVNPDRFDLSKRFGGQDNQNLAEFIGKGDPQRVTFRLDSWSNQE